MYHSRLLPQPHETSGITRPSVLARKRLRNELRGQWLEDKNFFETFFPVDAKIRRAASEPRGKVYNESGVSPRWMGIPNNPKSLNSRLYSELNHLLNTLCNFMIDGHKINRRLFIQTYRRKVLPDLNRPIWPAILLAGSDLFFLRRRNIRPEADYCCSISPLEVILEGADMEIALGRLATMVQASFAAQPTRRFIFGLVISASSVTCCLFDHSGIITSPPLDYHKDPDQFCALIAGLASTESSRIGLDTSAFLDGTGRACIGTRDSARKHKESGLYFLIRELYHAPRMMGRGTSCFLAHKGADTETEYVIKDAWISTDDAESEGRDSEAALLCHVKSKGITKGVARISHFEDVRAPGSDGTLVVDNIYNNRQLKPSEYPNVSQLVHTRIIMSTYGKPLGEFSTRKELLLAFYDAVRAHRNLYETAGILHRDIKPDNILINADGEDGARGIIIDFDHAIRIDNTSPYSKRRKIGTYDFMSINALDGENPHGYLDDLESFYYVLLYIISMFTGPHTLKDEIPVTIKSWSVPGSSTIKLGQFLVDTKRFMIEPWFGDSFRRLAQRLQSFFASRLVEPRRVPPSPPPHTSDSDEFISHIRQAIVELEEEEKDSKPLLELRPRGVGSMPGASRPKYPRTRVHDTLAALRELRPNVNYGRPKYH